MRNSHSGHSLTLSNNFDHWSKILKKFNICEGVQRILSTVVSFTCLPGAIGTGNFLNFCVSLQFQISSSATDVSFGVSLQ